MKSILPLLLLIVCYSLAESRHKIALNGKVGSLNSSQTIAAQISIQSPDFIITIETDPNGKFSTVFSEVSRFTVIIQAKGYEKQERIVTIPSLKADSVIVISSNLTPIVKMKLSGLVLDKKTSKPIKAEFDLFLDNDMVKENVEIIEDGKYSETLTDFGWYIINVSAQGYLNLSDTIWLMDCNRIELNRNYHLTPLEAGLSVRLSNIQFNFGKTSLHPNSFEELKNVAELVKNNPGLKLEIGGHTDSDGPDDYNLWLSQSRAQAVVDYLVSQGCNSDQLVAKGYGESKPIDNRETLLAKSVNRRVEFTVLPN